MEDMGRNWSYVGALKRGIIICAVKVLSTNKKPTWDACGYQLSRPSKGLTLGPFSATQHTTMPYPHLPFGSPISPSLHKLDEETHISQPVSWPHFIHLSALEDKKMSHTTNPTTVSHPRKSESLATLLWKSQILQHVLPSQILCHRDDINEYGPVCALACAETGSPLM